METTQISEQVGYPAQTTRRTLEDLTAHGVLLKRPLGEGESAIWELSPWALGLCEVIFGTVPEKSGDRE
jgi:DNA-binding IclR family transcriptional regulator